MRIADTYTIEEDLHEKIKQKRLILDVSKSEAVNQVLDFGFKYEIYQELFDYLDTISSNRKDNTKKIIDSLTEYFKYQELFDYLKIVLQQKNITVDEFIQGSREYIKKQKE